MNTPRTFEWDIAKAAANAAKHGVTFEFAAGVFLDAAVVVEPTFRDEDGENRYKAVGAIGGKLYAVVFTLRGEAARLISARRTNRKEDRIYGNR